MFVERKKSVFAHYDVCTIVVGHHHLVHRTTFGSNHIENNKFYHMLISMKFEQNLDQNQTSLSFEFSINDQRGQLRGFGTKNVLIFKFFYYFYYRFF